MKLFLLSIITGLIGAFIGGIFGREQFAIIVGLLGFIMPYAYVLQCLYDNLCVEKKDKPSSDEETNMEDNS